MEIWDWLQWPAMVVTLAGTWLVGSLVRRQRILGFVIFLLSNVLWVLWGWFAHAYALIILQLALTVMNVRGIFKNDQ